MIRNKNENSTEEPILVKKYIQIKKANKRDSLHATFQFRNNYQQ